MLAHDQVGALQFGRTLLGPALQSRSSIIESDHSPAAYLLERTVDICFARPPTAGSISPGYVRDKPVYLIRGTID